MFKAEGTKLSVLKFTGQLNWLRILLPIWFKGRFQADGIFRVECIFIKATSQLMIFDIAMHMVDEDQTMPTQKRAVRWQ